MSLKAIFSTIDETTKIANEKKDIRIVISALGNVSDKIRAMSEIRDTPDNRFVSLVFYVLVGLVTTTFEGQEEAWYVLNRELSDQCRSQIIILLNGMRSSLEAKNFEKAIDVLKTSCFALYPIIRKTSS